MIPAGDALQVVGLAVAATLGVALLGVLALRVVRTKSLIASLAVVVAVSVGAVVAGALGSASAMFLSGHDLRVLLVVTAVAGPVAFGTALVVGRTVVADTRALGVAAQNLGEQAYAGPAGPLAAELRALDVMLSSASSRLRESRGRERALESSRRELVAWVSHDLRTPLAGIRAMAEALEDGVVVDAGTVHRYHAGIRVEADRLAVMVDDLFELSRIHACALALTLQEVSLADVVSDAVASASPVAMAKGVRLTAAAAEDLVPITGSVPELGRVLRNLLSNAIRHTPADGVVHVDVRTVDGVAQVEVADACGGIPAEDLPRVFDVAFRGTAARTPGEAGGAGLGLAIAQGLVQAHHGEISIANHGPGCRVLVRLPVRV